MKIDINIININYIDYIINYEFRIYGIWSRFNK